MRKHTMPQGQLYVQKEGKQQVNGRIIVFRNQGKRKRGKTSDETQQTDGRGSILKETKKNDGKRNIIKRETGEETKQKKA